MIETEMGLIKQLTRIADALEELVKQNEKALGDMENEKRKRVQEEEKNLRLLMQNPKYWRDQDPEMVKRVEEGFKRLYG